MNFALEFVHCISTKCLSDLTLALAVGDSNFDESIRDGLVATELHDVGSDLNSEVISHLLNLVEVRLRGERRSHSLETLLSSHEALQLRLRIVTLVLDRLVLINSLLLNCLQVGVHLSLELSEFLSGLRDRLIGRAVVVTRAAGSLSGGLGAVVLGRGGHFRSGSGRSLRFGSRGLGCHGTSRNWSGW